MSTLQEYFRSSARRNPIFCLSSPKAVLWVNHIALEIEPRFISCFSGAGRSTSFLDSGRTIRPPETKYIPIPTLPHSMATPDLTSGPTFQIGSHTALVLFLLPPRVCLTQTSSSAGGSTCNQPCNTILKHNDLPSSGLAKFRSGICSCPALRVSARMSEQ